jgi:hypothetical protein
MAYKNFPDFEKTMQKIKLKKNNDNNIEMRG